MKKIYNTISIKGKSRDEWLELRKQGIGGSDVGTILGLNPYKSSYELWGEKVGIYTPAKIESPAMFWGNRLEPVVRDVMKYYEDDATSELSMQKTIKNFTEGKVKNKIRYVKAYMYRSVKHPYMLANVDGFIYIGGHRGILEVKTINSWVKKQFEGGIPPYHLVQLQHYLYVLGDDFGLLGSLADGRDLEVMRFNRDEDLIEKIVRAEEVFWDTVVRAKDGLKRGLIEDKLPHPPIDESPATERFFREKFEDVGGVIDGDETLWELGKQYKKYKEEGKVLNTKVQKIKNEIIHIMGKKKGNTVDFGKNGKIVWKKYKEGGNRVFRVNVSF